MYVVQSKHTQCSICLPLDRIFPPLAEVLEVGTTALSLCWCTAVLCLHPDTVALSQSLPALFHPCSIKQIIPYNQLCPKHVTYMIRKKNMIPVNMR